MPAILPVLTEFLGGGLGSAIALSGSPGAMTMLVAIAAACMFIAFTVASHSGLAVAAGARHRAAVRRHAERTVFLPLCDPAAAGRPQPRAPSAHHRVT